MPVRSRCCALLLAALLSTFAASSASALSFSNLYVFGDSLVDQGNTQAAVLAATAATLDVTPAALGYFGGRFTNGINPADVLNRAVEGSNAVGSLFGGDNYAFGGARARADADQIPDLALQIGAYLTAPAVGGSADPNALYFLNVGGNDARDIALGGLVGVAREQVIDDAVSAITTAITALQTAGAKHFLFAGVGDVGGIPEIASMGDAAAANGRAASQDLNAAIEGALPASLIFYDTIALTDFVQTTPVAFGLPAGIDFANTCLPLPVGSGLPADPACPGFAFFDEVHPTTAVLQILGDELVMAVPEPGTAVLLLLGLSGLAARRRDAGV